MRRNKRCTRTGSRRRRWTDPAFPDANPHSIRRFDDGEFDIRPVGKRRVTLDRRAKAFEPLVGRQRTKQDGLRVADVEDHQWNRLLIDRDRELP